MIEAPALVPELDVSDLAATITVYREVFGFQVLADRPQEAFAYLALGTAHVMVQEAKGPGRRFRTAPLDRPFGRGINVQIRVVDVMALFRKVSAAGLSVVLPMEERWYRQHDVERGNRQFVVADPDRYLLRFYEDIGSRLR